MASPNQVMLLTSISKKLARKVKLNRNRRMRRKRNKKFFLLKLKSKRAARSTDSLCEKIVDLFDIGGNESDQTMDINNTHASATGTTGGHFAHSMQEVAEWQNQHQLAYWKSKALALQMENQILHKHIKHLYANQMQQYLTYKEAAWQPVPIHEVKSKETRDHKGQKAEVSDQIDEREEVAVEMDEMSLPPSEQPGEARRKKLIEMYGDKAAKINGMETAMQLNFEHYMNKEKPPFWPNIPLKP